MLAPLLETVITHKVFEDDLVSGNSRASATQEEFKNTQQVVIVNPTKYTVKNEDDQQNCCDASLNDSFEDEYELIKEEKKNNKKGDKKKKDFKKSTP